MTDKEAVAALREIQQLAFDARGLVVDREMTEEERGQLTYALGSITGIANRIIRERFKEQGIFSITIKETARSAPKPSTRRSAPPRS
jgi:hypothetical protein